MPSRIFARRGQAAGPRAGMFVDRDVVVQPVHELPGLGFAEHLDPGRDVEVAGARRGRVGHRELALEARLGEVEPRDRPGQAELGGLDRVEAHRGHPGLHADPGRRVGGIAEGGLDGRQVPGRVRLEQAALVERQHRGDGKTPDRVGALHALLGQDAGGDDAGGIAVPDDLDVGVLGLERLLEVVDVLDLQGRIDLQPDAVLRRGGRGAEREQGRQHEASRHRILRPQCGAAQRARRRGIDRLPTGR